MQHLLVILDMKHKQNPLLPSLSPAGVSSQKEVLSRLHFSPVPVFALGNWIPQVLYYWGCMGRNCGLSQAVFTSEGKSTDMS